MLSFTQSLSIPKVKTVLFTTLFMGTVHMLAGCDSQSSISNNNVTAQIDDVDKNIPKNDEASVNPAPINSDIGDNAQNHKQTNLSNDANDANDANDEIVSPSGYQKLSFGQVITPKLLSDLGLTKKESDNEQCYYLSHPRLNYVDKEYGKRGSVLYQIIDNKVALITIQDSDTPFYKDINVGDSVTDVMKAHNDEPTYEVDKYAVDGDYYNLIANVNFKVIKESQLGESLKDENIKLDDKEDKLPIQIKYHIKGGQKLNDYEIKATEWTADNKNLLKGEVESIDIGIPEAIYLVEGCS